MIETRVRVVASGNGLRYVEPTESSGCGGCSVQSSCAVSALGKLFARRRGPTAVACNAGNHGDELVVGVEETALLGAGFAVYLIPAVLTIVAAVLATSHGLGDAAAALAAGIGLGNGLLVARFIDRTPQLDVRPAPFTESGLTHAGLTQTGEPT